MSLEEEDDFWNSSDVKAFNFDDEDQSLGLNAQNSHSTSNNVAPIRPIDSGGSSLSVHSPGMKTLGSILAASNEPFLRPSMIMCNGDNIEELIEYLDETIPIFQSISPKQDPKAYIKDIVDNRVPIDFSSYKSKRDKLLLLDCAICCSDGNTITAASIFISKTLKPSIFIKEMKKRPIAVDHYVNYLELTCRAREAAELVEKLSDLRN